MVLDLVVPTDAEIVRYPDRYVDPRGAEMWAHVTELVRNIGEVRDIREVGDVREVREVGDVREV